MPDNDETQTQPQQPAQPSEPKHEDTGGRVIERTEKVIERPAPAQQSPDQQ